MDASDPWHWAVVLLTWACLSVLTAVGWRNLKSHQERDDNE